MRQRPPWAAASTNRASGLASRTLGAAQPVAVRKSWTSSAAISARLRNLRVSFELMLTPMLYGLDTAQQHQAGILRRCAELFDAGKLRIHLAKTFPLTQAAEAHRLIETGGMTGKLALVMDER